MSRQNSASYDLDTRGVINLSIELIFCAIKRFDFYDMKDLHSTYFKRRSFLDSKIFQATVDVLEYDYEKFHTACVKRLDKEFEYAKSVRHTYKQYN